MSKIFFLQLLCDFNSEKHYENVYSTKEIAIQQGIIKLEKMFREEYEKMFEQDNKNNHFKYSFDDKLHVITDVPHKMDNQEFFRNTYDVIVNHNSYDEGCHVDIFNENELELYTEDLPSDSPLIFLSKYVKGEMKLDNISWMDIECGHITLNENKSFRDIPEIMKKLNGGL